MSEINSGGSYQTGQILASSFYSLSQSFKKKWFSHWRWRHHNEYSTLIGQEQSKIVKAPKKSEANKKREIVCIKREKCKMTGTDEITSDDIQIGNTADVHWKKEHF